MVKIKVIRDGVWVKDGRAEVGKTYEVTADAATSMVDNGLAEKVAAKTKTKKAD